MKPFFQVFTYMIITLTVIICQKDNDEGRAYEFGFTIDGQQHRHEKKDQNGIIQGEFGFITADGIYHVTVYATDENGDFKILSMKNIRISAPLDGSPATGPISPEAGKYLKKSNGMKQPNTPTAPVPQRFEELQQQPVGPQVQNIITTQNSRAPYVFTTKPTIKPACGGCGYVTTAKPVPVGNAVIEKPVGSFPQEFQNKFGQFQSATPGQNNPPPDMELLPPGVPGGNIAVVPSSYQGTYQGSQQFLNAQQGFQSSLSASQGSGTYQNSQQPLLSSGFQGDNLTPNIAVAPQSIQGTYQSSQQFSNSQQGYQGSISMSQGSGINQHPQQPNKYGQFQSETPTRFQGGIPNAVQPNLQTNQDVHAYPNNAQQNYQNPGGYNQNQNSVFQNQDKQRPVQGNAEILTNIPGIGNIDNKGRLEQLNAPPRGSTKPNSLPSTPEAPKLPPVSVSDNVIHVGGKNPIDIPIKDKFPGMVDGLPNGVEETDVKNILYKFKYTVGFHGHYEKGLKNGTKIGGYFVNGRDGISRVVTYVADENGYRPKFKFINLGLDSPKTPKEDTEKTFGLESFEFVWYPIE